eukprot:7381190-Prymnesium_polylepis.1
MGSPALPKCLGLCARANTPRRRESGLTGARGCSHDRPAVESVGPGHAPRAAYPRAPCVPARLAGQSLAGSRAARRSARAPPPAPCRASCDAP